MKTIISTIIIALLSCTSFVFAQQNLPSDFPEYQNTGDKKADNAAYDQAKKAWVETKPEAYRKMGGQIEVTPQINEHSSETEVENCEKTEEVAITIPNDCVVWEITDAVIIDKYKQLKNSELDALSSEIREEFLRHKIQWKISPKGIVYIFYHKKYSNHYKFEKTNNQLILLPSTKTACDDEIKVFSIEKWTDTQIIINMPDEDEGSTLFYQLTLTSTL